jgi:pimeloyl-ACP methyl ester carboxylesterase
LSDSSLSWKGLLHSNVTRWIGGVLGALLLLLVVSVVLVYAWPLGSHRLREAQSESLDFGAATARAEAVIRAEGADPDVRAECRSQLLTHGARAAKAVLLLHGYTACPAQYSDLAKTYFDHGYNVFVPRAPRHGLVDQLAHAKVTAVELVDYAAQSLNIAAGLGDDVGVVGISGGGVLATWLTEYRPGTVRHALVLSPFYRPNPAQATGYEIKPLTVLFGFRIVPDRIDSNGFSYSALSQYLRIRANFRQRPVNDGLSSMAVVFSDGDTFVDHRAAVDIPRQIAETNKISLTVRELGREFGLAHDIVTPDDLHGRQDELNQLYLDLYEGVQTGERSLTS